MQDLSCGETEQTTTTDMPNGLTTIRESSDQDIVDKPPHSPSSSSESTSMHSKLKSTPKPLGASKSSRRASDTSVTRKPTATKLRPASVSSSKIPPKSPHYKKHT